ncbi:MAG: universal stress protein [Thermodesulfobacteriota bacterium]
MIKRILIPLDSSSYTDTAIDLGCDFARRHDAELTGLVILDIPGIEKTVRPIPLGGVHSVDVLEKSIREEAKIHIKKVLDRFKEKCRKANVRHRQAERQGSPSERIIRESMFYDFVVIGLRTYYHFKADSPGDSLEHIMDHATTPLYAVPEHASIPDDGKIKVLTAFNGCLPSARALHWLARMAFPETTEVTVLMSDPDKEISRYYLDQAEAYLNAHSMTKVNKEWTTQSIIDAVNAQYLDWADMVVLGAHCKKRMMDFMLGSLAKHLIDEAKKPLIIGL